MGEGAEGIKIHPQSSPYLPFPLGASLESLEVTLSLDLEFLLSSLPRKDTMCVPRALGGNTSGYAGRGEDGRI